MEKYPRGSLIHTDTIPMCMTQGEHATGEGENPPVLFQTAPVMSARLVVQAVGIVGAALRRTKFVPVELANKRSNPSAAASATPHIRFTDSQRQRTAPPHFSALGDFDYIFMQRAFRRPCEPGALIEPYCRLP